MTERSGLIVALQAASAHAIVDTYYDTTEEIIMGVRCNSLRLYVTSAVASPGDVSFRLTINNPGNPDMGATTYYDYCTDGEAPETFGPLKFTGATQTKMIILRGLNLVPLDAIQVSYAASAGAASATLAIVGETFHSDLGDSSISTGDIEVDVAALEVLSTAANALLTTIAAATGGTAGTSYMFGEDASFVTGDSPATVDVNAGLGYNGNLGWIANDGAGDFTIEISKVGTPTLGSSITIQNGEVFSFDGLDVDQFTITWVADSSYRYFIQ